MIGESDLWYKNGIFYALDVKTFQDSDGDGIGDFIGLTSRLDYLATFLGVTCLWLLPFYPSPLLDNGYDVKDYYNVDPRLGTLGDFVEFSRKAEERGMRVMIDLVVNHTSIEHPWFQEARRNPDSKYRNYYVWADEVPEGADKGTVFPGVETSTWTYDEQAGAYYLHRFYSHQPDLNTNHPVVQDEIRKIMGFWIKLGVSGFRLDAAPFIVELKEIQQVQHERDEAPRSDPHLLLQRMREFLSWRQGDAVFLAEANVLYDQVGPYVGQGNRMHMMFNFLLNQHLFLALTRQRSTPLVGNLRQLPNLPQVAQWVNFLRNHDELDLGRLGDSERQEIYEQMAPDSGMRIYGRGIRRRLAPMLGGDERRMQMAYSLMFSLPGTPMLFYGEELGMSEDLALPERESVRTTMQWSEDENGGFSSAPPDQLLRAAQAEGPYGYRRLNARAQQREPGSFLNWLRHLIDTRRDCPEIGWGTLELIETYDERVLAYRYQWQGRVLILVHNLSSEQCSVTLDLTAYEASHLVDLLGDRQYRSITHSSHEVALQAFGFSWLRVQRYPPYMPEWRRLQL